MRKILDTTVQGGAARESHAVNERAFLNIMILRQRALQSTFNALLFAVTLPPTLIQLA